MNADLAAARQALNWVTDEEFAQLVAMVACAPGQGEEVQRMLAYYLRSEVAVPESRIQAALDAVRIISRAHETH
jgi:hypothetical protein